VSSKVNVLFRLAMFSALCFVAFMPEAQAFKIRSAVAFGEKYVYLADVAKYYGVSLQAGRTQCSLTGRNTRITFVYNKRCGWYNGVKIPFSRPPYLKGGDPMVSETDFLSVLDPMIRPSSLRKHRLVTVVLDPGHGAHDEGARGRRSREKDLALKICLKLRDVLRNSYGYQVVLTRGNDVFVPLEGRPAVAARKGGDIFISLHCNSAKPSITGVETFAYTPRGEAATGGGRESNSWQPADLNQKNSVKLAYEIQKSVVSTTKAVDRGVKHARFAVLRLSARPAVLVEAGFISSPTEERKLMDERYQLLLARSIARGIYSYHHALASGSRPR